MSVNRSLRIALAVLLLLCAGVLREGGVDAQMACQYDPQDPHFCIDLFCGINEGVCVVSPEEECLCWLGGDD
jgi:hypothetical protein